MSETPSTADADTVPDSKAAPKTQDRPSDSTAVSMRKPTRGNAGATPKPTPAPVPAPLTINIVTAALIVMVLGSVARALLLLLGSTATLQNYARDVNNKAKKPDKNFDVVHAVHQIRAGAVIQAVIFGIALLLLAYAMRRVRSASATRWAVLIIFVYTGMPFYVIPTSGLPVSVQVAGVAIGVASIAAVLLIFIPPQSQKYFRACRDANRPPDASGPSRPGLASLFGPKRPRGAAPARGGGLFGGGARGPAGASRTPPASAPPRPAAPKAKAKVRSDSDAIAKGAELARSRAKASKSRRTPD